MNMKFLFSLMLLPSLSVAPAAENLIFNSGFELGSAGFSVLRSRPLENFRGGFDPSGGAFPERKEVKSGQGALRLVSLPDQRLTLCSSEIELKPATRYTFSFWAKCNADLKLVWKLSSRQQEKEKLIWKDLSRTFSPGREWKEYSCTVTTPPAPHRYYNFYLSVQGAGTVFMDNLQLAEGASVTPWTPASDPEAAVFLPEIVTDAASLSGKLRAVSYSADRNAEFDLLFCAVGKTDAPVKKSLRVPLKRGIASETEFRFAPFPYGCFQVRPVMGGRELPPGARGMTVHCHAPVWKNTAGGSGFKLGVNTAILGRYTSNEIVDSTGTGEERGKYLSYLGNLMRIWNPGEINWALCNPAPGKFDFSRILSAVEIARRNGFDLEVTISDGWTWMPGKPNRNIPQWTWERDLAGRQYPTSDRTDTTRMVKLPRYEDWSAYAAAFAAAVGDRVRFVDLMNEPNCSFSGKTYAKYMKAAYDAIKKANPRIRVVAGSATEDLGARAAEFLRELVSSPEASSMDLLSFHPYGSRQDDSPVPAQNRIRQFRQIVRDAGGKVPLWNDECFYLQPVARSHYMLEHDLPVGAVSRRILIDMGEGCFASTPLHSDQTLDDPLNPNRVIQSWDSRCVPSKLFAEMNALACFLAGAEPLATVEQRGEYLGYVFANRGKTFSAIWSAGDPIQLRLNLPSGASFRMYDLYGNPMAAGKVLALTRVPVYLEWSGVPAERAAEILRSGAVSVENPFRVGPLRWSVRDGKTGLQFELGNRNSKPVSGFVRVNAREFRNRGGRAEFSLLRKESPVSIFVPLTLQSESVKEIPVTLLVASDDRLISVKRTVRITPRIVLEEGVLSGPYPIARIAEGKAPASASDLSAEFSLLRKGDELSVRVRVTDDVAGKGKKLPFLADCVELFWDPEPFRCDEKYPDRYAPGTRQIFINPYRTPHVSLIDGKEIPGIQVAVTQRRNGYDMTIRLPLPRNAECVGFDLAVDDSDSPDTRKTQLVWSGDGKNHADRSGFALLFPARNGK